MIDTDRTESTVPGEPVPGGVSEAKLLEIARIAEKKTVTAHTVLYRQGDPGDAFYVIISGKVRVFRRGREGVETDFSHLGPGDSFGEMALLTGRPRTAHAETTEETQLLVVRKERFDRVLGDRPNISRTFVEELSHLLIQDE
jgi:CRP-like cAMP-binding protein